MNEPCKLLRLAQGSLLAAVLLAGIPACSGNSYAPASMSATEAIKAGWASFQIEGMT
ncbi:MAG TPA: hypothetical protein P5218_09800 [Planctomycetota bacterium]|nr:hypothetical protein [Planctomycetota bacterium]